MKRLIILLFIISLVFSGCEKAFDAYIGFPLQPKNIDSEFVPGLNIFGILKAGSTLDTLNHYFEIQQIINVFDTTSNLTIDQATITLSLIKPGNPVYFILDTIGEGKYTDSLLNPQFGETWNYQCVYDTFLVKSTTIIPNEPKITEGSLSHTDSRLNFIILNDTTAFMYDIYFLNGTGFSQIRIIPEQDKNTSVDMDIQFNSNSTFNDVYIFAYDKNYEQYISTSNIFFKPNAFRPKFSTVEGGYGCFCSVSSLKVSL